MDDLRDGLTPEERECFDRSIAMGITIDEVMAHLRGVREMMGEALCTESDEVKQRLLPRPTPAGTSRAA